MTTVPKRATRKELISLLRRAVIELARLYENPEDDEHQIVNQMIMAVVAEPPPARSARKAT